MTRRRAASPTSRGAASHPFTDDGRGPRLQKVLAEAGVGSRRHCEQLIEAGQVTVNGVLVASLPAWVNPRTDKIIAAGRRIEARERHVYVMLFKPRGVVTTNDDPEGRRRAIDLVDHPSGVRLYPVGRLDLDSSGLLLLTNDGELTNRLTHPRYEMHNVYEVTVAGALDLAAVKELAAGLFADGSRKGEASRSTLTFLKRDGDKTLLLMELREGRNREFRHMFAELGHPVKKLRQIQLGPLKLKGLSAGGWRELASAEVKLLKQAAMGQTRKRRQAETRKVS